MVKMVEKHENRSKQDSESSSGESENELIHSVIETPPPSKQSFRVTVEVIVFLVILGASMSGAVLYNLVLYRTCVHALGHTKEECSPFLGPHTSNDTKALEQRVQEYSMFINTVKMVMESLVPAILSFFLGSWSDKHGRKPLLTWPLVGVTLTWALTVVYAMMDNLGPWWYLVTAIPLSLSGGFGVLFTGAFCYISDITTNENRSFRMTLLDASTTVAIFIGSMSSSFVLRAVGNVYLLLLATTLFVITYVYSNLCIKESVNNQVEGSISSVLNISHVKEMFSECVKDRPNHGRRQILLLLFTSVLSGIVMFGLLNLEYPYARSRIHWAMTDFTVYSATNTAIVFAGNFVGLLAVQKYFGLSDLTFAIISFLSAISEYVIKTFAEVTWHMYFGSAISLFKGLSAPLTRSIVTKILPPEDIAKVLSLMGAFGSICPLLSPLIYNSLYAATVTTFPMSIYLLSIGLTIVNVIMLGMVQYYRRTAASYHPLDKTN